MRKFSRDEWYFDGVTWCGITEEGERFYPISYGDNGCAWAMTKDIARCLNFQTIGRVKKQLHAELKYNPFFQFHYPKVELVYIKEYPTFYFDYQTIAKKLNIKIDRRWHDEELVPHLQKYGFEPISDNPKIIEVSRDDGSFYRAIVDELNKDRHSLKEVKNSCFTKPTYLLESKSDLELLLKTVKDSERLAYLYEEDIDGFSLASGDVYFPCFAVVDGVDSIVYSEDEVKELRDNANSMLDLLPTSKDSPLIDIKGLMDIIERHCEIITQPQYDELYQALADGVKKMVETKQP